MKTRTFLAFIFVLLLSSCAKDIEDITGSINGCIRDAVSLEVIPGVLVKLEPNKGNQTTDSHGSYTFDGIAPSNYTLYFQKSGYQEKSTTVEVLSNKTITVDIFLDKTVPLTISVSELNFGEIRTSLDFYLTNQTSELISYTIERDAEWIIPSKSSGNIAAKGQDNIKVIIQREGLSIGEYTKELRVKYAGGIIPVRILMSQIEKSAPKVFIGEISNLTETSFSVSATLTSTGGLKISQHGHCYSEHENPTIADSHTTLGDREDIGEFSSKITGLVKNKTYYVRAYATNTKGTTYSEQLTITMPTIDKPIVATINASDITTTSALLNGIIQSLSGGEITERGFYYGTTENPTNKVKSTDTANSFSYHLTELSPNTTYYFQAYATNSAGEGKGSVISFTTGEEGGQTVKIITQEATNITSTSAQLNAQLMGGDSFEIREFGFIYGPNKYQTQKVKVGDGYSLKNEFSLSIPVSANSTYWYAAYADTFSDGYIQGTFMSFTTSKDPYISRIRYKSYAVDVDSHYKTLDVDLYAEFENEGLKVEDAGFLIGTSGYSKEMTLHYNYDHMDIIPATVSGNTFQYKGTLPVVDRVYDAGRYIRAYVVFSNGKEIYSPCKYIYGGSSYDESY